MALDACVQIAGARRPAHDPAFFVFQEYRQTDLEPGEIIRAIEIPKPIPALDAFYKVAKRRMDDISTVAAGVALDLRRRRTASRGPGSHSVAWRPRRCAFLRLKKRRSGDAGTRRQSSASSANWTRAANRSATIADRRHTGWRWRRADRKVLVGVAGGMKYAGQSVPHESAREHVTGEALYTDDLVLAFRGVACVAGNGAACARAAVRLDARACALGARRRHRAHGRRCSGRKRLRRESPRRTAVSLRGDVLPAARGLGAGRRPWRPRRRARAG